MLSRGHYGDDMEPDKPDQFPKAVVVLLIIIAVLILLVLIELKDLNSAVGA